MKKLVFAGLTLAFVAGCSATPLNDADAPSDAKAVKASEAVDEPAEPGDQTAEHG